MIHAALDPHMISNALNDNSESPFHLKGQSSKLVSFTWMLCSQRSTARPFSGV